MTMAATPRFKIGDRIYLKSSAGAGFLESYLVSRIAMKSTGGWQYMVVVRQKPPQEQTVGDRIDLKTEQPFIYDESELMDACEAITSVVANLQARLIKAQAMQTAICGGEPTGGGQENFWNA